MPVQVTSFLVPRNGNTWYVLEDKYLKGGLRVVADEAERSTIHSSSLKEGMLVVMKSDNLIYQLGADLTTWTVYPGIKGADGAAGPVGPQGPAGPAGPKGDPGSGGSGAGSAGLFVTSVTGGNVNRSYAANTIPANRVVTAATTDSPNAVTVVVQAEGGSSAYSPVVRVDVDPANPSTTGVVASIALASGANERLFNATAVLDLSALAAGASKTINIWSDTGVTTSVEITRAAAGPLVATAVMSVYPGSQTAVKAGDAMTVTGKVENSASVVELVASSGAVGAGTFTGTLGAVDSAGAGYRTYSIPFTVGSGTGAQAATVKAKNALGTYGANFTSNTITLDQVAPSVGAITVTYPASQSALKSGEQATVNSTIANADAVTFSSTDAGLAIANPTTLANSKTVTYTGNGYTDSGTNYRITATRAANGSTTVVNGLVNIAAVAPTFAVTISGNPARLISSVSGSAYTVNITADQNLLAAPTLQATAGTLSAVTGAGKAWTATLTIQDSTTRGAQQFAVSGNNRAGINSNTLSNAGTYTVGGFTKRTLTFGAFEQVAALPALIGNPAKVTVTLSGSSSAFTYRASDLSQFASGFSIVNATFDAQGSPRKYSNYVFNANGPFLFLTDLNFANSNTSGTLKIDIQEDA